MILSYLRLAYRVPLALMWTLVWHWTIRARQMLRPTVWGTRGGKRQTWILGQWGRGLAWIMGVRVVRRNERQGPMGDLIVANHMGFLDVPALLSIFPAVFIIKMEMRKVPYFGRALEHQRHIFVERGLLASQRSAAKGVREVLENGDRLIVFPEGRASPGAERLPFRPFCFNEAARQGKRVEVCVIDYLPDRKMLEWDIHKPTLPQLVKLFGRHRTHVGVEFLGSEIPKDGREAAKRYQALVQAKMHEYDGAASGDAAPAGPGAATGTAT